MTEGERQEALERVAAEARACTRCRLHESRSEAVPGEGHPSTEVLFVGEAPGLNEDRQGRPFVGAAGGFLAELLATVGWSRDEVFITNIVKCRPPQNRDPEPDEIAACAPFLRRQVEALDPALIVTLGRHSMGRFMPGARIGQVHGTTAPAPADTGAADALVFAMYHPAAALHQASLRQTLLEDMAGVPTALLDARRLREAVEAGMSETGAGPGIVEGAVSDEEDVKAGNGVQAITGDLEPEPLELAPDPAPRPPDIAPRPPDIAPSPALGYQPTMAPEPALEPGSHPASHAHPEPGPVPKDTVAVLAGADAAPTAIVPGPDPAAVDQMTLF